MKRGRVEAVDGETDRGGSAITDPSYPRVQSSAPTSTGTLSQQHALSSSCSLVPTHLYRVSSSATSTMVSSTTAEGLLFDMDGTLIGQLPFATEHLLISSRIDSGSACNMELVCQRI